MKFVLSAETRSPLFQGGARKTLVARLMRIDAELDKVASVFQPQGGTSEHRERGPTNLQNSPWWAGASLVPLYKTR